MSTWFYYDSNGQKQGPVTGGQLKGLAKTGRISPDTKVETEDGKSATAGKVKGLTFLGATPSEPNVTTGTEGMTEKLEDQDFEQLREDFELLQARQEQQQRTQYIASPTAPVPPVQPRPFHPNSSVPSNPFNTPVATTSPTIPQNAVAPIAGSSKNSHWITIVGALVLLVIGGIVWAVIRNDGNVRIAQRLNEVAIAGLNRDVISDLPLEIITTDFDWSILSDANASAEFSLEMQTTEPLYKSIDNESALHKLGVTITRERDFYDAVNRTRNPPLSHQNSLRNFQTDRLPERFYDVLVPRGGIVTLTGTVELTKSSNDDWRVARFLVNRFYCGQGNHFSCGNDFTLGADLPEGTRLDDPRTREIVNTIIQSRNNFVSMVDRYEQEWKRNFDRFCAPGTAYVGTYQIGQARGDVRVSFDGTTASGNVRGTIAFSFPDFRGFARPFEVVANTGAGTIDNSRVPNNTAGFQATFGQGRSAGANDFFILIQNFRQVEIRFTDNAMDFSVSNSNVTIPLNLLTASE